MVSMPSGELVTQPAANAASGLYEQPLSERMRTFLRLEFLYQQFCHNLEQPTEWATRTVITSILDMLSILGRGDVRGDVLKELERQVSLFDRYRDLPGVDEARLRRVLRNLQDLRQRLLGTGPQFLQPVRESEFLSAIKHRSAIPGGTCEFDLPDYSFWLRRSYEQRTKDIERWTENLRPLCDSIAELLWLMRQAGQWTDRVAVSGLYHHTLGSEGSGAALLRVSLPRGTSLYPEISGSHHRVTVRFMQWDDVLQRPSQTTRDVRFRLTVC